MDKVRGFEVAKGWEDKGINLPQRSTKYSAGYDFEAAKDVVVHSIFQEISENEYKEILEGFQKLYDDKYLINKGSSYYPREHRSEGFATYEDDAPSFTEEQFKYMKELGIFKPSLVPTGIKSYMQEGEFLSLVNRSSNPIKNRLMLSNGFAIIDKDYYNNPDNDGHIMFQFINFGVCDYFIHKGDRIGQGIFLPFLLSDDDKAMGERTGGFGSTDK